MDGDSLDAFVATRPPRSSPATRWWGERPALAARVQRAVQEQKYDRSVVWRWLKAEHAYPFGQGTLTARFADDPG